MKIIQLNIVEFGGLKNKVVELDGGFNILWGDNESGKSTVMLFIRFMLYGLPKKGAKGMQRERALSWENKRAEGIMTFEHDGRNIRVERRTAAVGTRLNDSLTVTDTDTGERLEGEAGQIFLGVPAEIFESSCSISQMRVADVSGDKTASAIENMLVSADESIDVKAVLAAMDKVRRQYKLNKGEGGLIYDTEREISELRVKYREATQKHLSYNDMSARLERAEENLGKIEESHKITSHNLEQLKGARILLRFAELDDKRQSLDGIKNELSELVENEKRGDFLPDMTHANELKSARLSLNEARVKVGLRKRECDGLPELDVESKRLAEQGERIRSVGGKQAFIKEAMELNSEAEKKKKSGVTLCALGAIAAAIGTALVAVTFIATIAACAVGFVLIGLGTSLSAKAKKLSAKRDEVSLSLGAPYSELDAYAEKCLAALAKSEALESSAASKKALLSAVIEEEKQCKKKLIALLEMTVDKASVEGGDVMSIAAEEEERIRHFCEKRSELDREAYALSQRIGDGERELSGYDREALSKSVTVNLSEATDTALKNAELREKYDRERYAALDRETRNIREALAALRGGLTQSPVEIADRISELEAVLEKHVEYYDALMLAKTRIEQAGANMSGSVTPFIANKAGELLAAVSGGAHGAVQTTKELGLSVEQDGFFVDADMLSGGTRDASYVCLRISLMLRLFGASLPPLIMDEALCQLDDSRAENMLSLLSKLSSTTTQCILFTCHRRELELCQRLGIKVRGICMNEL